MCTFIIHSFDSIPCIFYDYQHFTNSDFYFPNPMAVFLVYFVSTIIATCERWLCWVHGCGFVLMGIFYWIYSFAVVLLFFSLLIYMTFYCMLFFWPDLIVVHSQYFAASPQILLLASFLLLLSFWWVGTCFLQCISHVALLIILRVIKICLEFPFLFTMSLFHISTWKNCHLTNISSFFIGLHQFLFLSYLI